MIELTKNPRSIILRTVHMYGLDVQLIRGCNRARLVICMWRLIYAWSASGTWSGRNAIIRSAIKAVQIISGKHCNTLNPLCTPDPHMYDNLPILLLTAIRNTYLTGQQWPCHVKQLYLMFTLIDATCNAVPLVSVTQPCATQVWSALFK